MLIRRNMTARGAFAGVICLASLAGCGKLGEAFPGKAQWILDAPDRLELMTVDPDLSATGPTSESIDGHRILGKALVTDGETRRRLVQALYDAVESNDSVREHKCFRPRHALRASRGGVTVDVVICFECKQMSVHVEKVYKLTKIHDAAAGEYRKAASGLGLPAATNPGEGE